MAELIAVLLFPFLVFALFTVLVLKPAGYVFLGAIKFKEWKRGRDGNQMHNE